jgi:hypothetical protein
VAGHSTRHARSAPLISPAAAHTRFGDADCFRFRNKVGLDVVIEALVEARRSRRLDLNELHRIAKVLRVDRVMQPYLEMLVA